MGETALAERDPHEDVAAVRPHPRRLARAGDDDVGLVDRGRQRLVAPVRDVAVERVRPDEGGRGTIRVGFHLGAPFEGRSRWRRRPVGRRRGSRRRAAAIRVRLTAPARASAASRARISVLASGRGAASRHRATAPVTCGAAMLVPDLRVSSPGLRGLPSGADRAASTSTPGATQSGFGRPSRVGPTLLNGATVRDGRVAVVRADDERLAAVGDGPRRGAAIDVVGDEARLARSAGLVAFQPRVEPAVDDAHSPAGSRFHTPAGALGDRNRSMWWSPLFGSRRRW